MQLKQGDVLQGGKYRIESVLGQGGFGITYRAFQAGLNRKVALKEFFMKDACNRDADSLYVSVPSVGSKALVVKFRDKFLKEAQMIASLNHPHIIRIHDIFEENGTAYYVMEYHDGGSLSDMELPMNPQRAVSYIRQICSALSYIHRKNIMHLDIKPANILLDEEGNAVLIDFGVSKRYDEYGQQTSSTPLCLSRCYAPIEQSGVSLPFSPATDIYALGATMYKLLTGQTPHTSHDLFSNPSLLSFPQHLPSDLVATIRKCMKPIVSDRPQTAADVLAMLGGENEKTDDETVINPTKAAESKSDVYTGEMQFKHQYNRMMATRMYMDAYKLCCLHAKDYRNVYEMAAQAYTKYYKKRPTSDFVIPCHDEISYEWIADQFMAKGYTDMVMKEKLYLRVASVEIIKVADQKCLRIKQRWTLLIYFLLLVIPVVGWVMLLGIAISWWFKYKNIYKTMAEAVFERAANK